MGWSACAGRRCLVILLLLGIAHGFLPTPGRFHFCLNISLASAWLRQRDCFDLAVAPGTPRNSGMGIIGELSPTMKAMQKFAEKYCEITDTYFCSDLDITATVIKGLAIHKEELGAPLCPCRHYEDKVAEVNLAYWNCPCVPMRERKECHCMLFLTKENPFVGKDQKISDEHLKEPAQAMI
uniref:ferredoxin:thioredoxin reductase n=1 Tax=Characiopsis acuta TaxID=2040456 RepID=A0A451FLF4_9STRA|nr:plastid ferredoxin-thioredoxin reductase beta subunit [Characiopsis acuta]